MFLKHQDLLFYYRSVALFKIYCKDEYILKIAIKFFKIKKNNFLYLQNLCGMNKRVYYLLLTITNIFLLVGTLYSQRRDDQFWGIASIQATISPKISIRFEEQFNLSKQAGGLEYQHNDIAVKYYPTNWLVIRPAYRQVYLFIGHEIIEENRLHINATTKWRLGNFEFSNLNRAEHRIIHGRDNYTRFRDILCIHYPITYKKMVLRPLIEEHLWVNQYKEIELNIVYAGILLIPIDIFNINFHYIWARRNNDGWQTVRGLGLRCRLYI